MKWLDRYRMGLVLLGAAGAIALGGGSAKADFVFGEPVNLGPIVNSSSGDSPGCFSSDGLEMYFDSTRSGGYGSWDIWVTRREALDDDWGAPVNLGPKVNSNQEDGCASISADGLELYFNSARPGGYGRWDIWVTKRVTKNDPWGQPTNLGPTVNASSYDTSPNISPDGLTLCFSSIRPGGYGSDDIWVSRRATKNDPWGEPINLGPVVNSSACEGLAFLSSDGLLLFFSEDGGEPIHPGGFGNYDMWVTRRSSVSDLWSTPVNLGPVVNTSGHDGPARITPGGSILYFGSERLGGYGGAGGDIYQSSIIPIVDFNGDGVIDAADMCIMVDHWGTDNPLCDIGPTPFGDGVVDIEDLKVLAEHLFEDYRLIGHWKLDETEGDIAYDSAGNNHGTLNGDPKWVSGFIDGALEFDGVDDYVEIGNFDLTGSFTLTCWMRPSSLPGPYHSVISKEFDYGFEFWRSNFYGSVGRDSNNWGAEVSTPISTTAIWYHAALTWNGSDLEMFIDGSSVGQDTGTHVSNNKPLLFGSWDKSSEFFNGIIDDVRIYNVALTAEEIAALAQ